MHTIVALTIFNLCKTEKKNGLKSGFFVSGLHKFQFRDSMPKSKAEIPGLTLLTTICGGRGAGEEVIIHGESERTVRVFSSSVLVQPLSSLQSQRKEKVVQNNNNNLICTNYGAGNW
jgi:hypothetical protein